MRRRDEVGSTLVESVLVILLVSTIILALASGLLATTVGSRKVNDSQRLSFAITSLVDTIRELPYQGTSAGCTPASVAAGYLAAYNALPQDQRDATKGLTVEILDAKFFKLNYSTTTIAGFDQWGGSCADKTGAVKLKVQVTLPSGKKGVTGSAVAEVVKRAPSRQG